MKPRLQILLVDDHAVIRAGVRSILAARFEADFQEAGDSQSALAAARRQAFDLIVLDVSLPGRSGVDILRDLQALQPAGRTLVLSAHAEMQFATHVLRAGAAGYITKDRAPEELVRAVEKVLAGGRYVSAALAEHLVDLLHGSHDGPRHEMLSAREFEILRQLARGRSGKEIAAELGLSFKTVSTYRTRVLAKLGLNSTAELAQYALRAGLLDEPLR